MIYIYIYRVFPTGVTGRVNIDQPKICSFPSSSPNFYSFVRKSQFNPIEKLKRHFQLQSLLLLHCTIFILISYSFETQITLVLNLIEVQYSQNAIFSFEKFSNRQNLSSSDFHQLVKKSSQQCLLLFDRKSGNL